jgi:hypothetical protein
VGEFCVYGVPYLIEIVKGVLSPGVFGRFDLAALAQTHHNTMNEISIIKAAIILLNIYFISKTIHIYNYSSITLVLFITQKCIHTVTSQNNAPPYPLSRALW